MWKLRRGISDLNLYHVNLLESYLIFIESYLIYRKLINILEYK